MLADAPRFVDVVVVDAYRRLAADRATLDALLAQLGGAGVALVALRPATGRRLARLAANPALADLVGSALR